MTRLVNRWGIRRRTIRCGMLASLASTQAQAAGSAMEYSAPADCPDRAAFLSDLRQLLGRELESIHDIVGFRVATERVGNSYRAVVSMDRGDERANRTIAGSDCSMLAHAAALSVAMAINHEESPGSGREPSEIATKPEAAALPAAPEPLPRRTETPLPIRLSGAVAPTAIFKPMGVDAMFAIPADLGTLPSATLGARLGLDITYGRWMAGIGVGALLPVAVTPSDAGSGARFWFAAGRVEGCVRMAGLETTAMLHACALFEAGITHGSGIDLTPDRGGNLAWLAPGPRLLAAFPLFGHGVRGQIGAEMLIPLVHGQFTMDGGRVLHETASYVGRLEIGVAVHLK